MSLNFPAHPSARRAAGGFTLLELMIVVVIVGILAAVAYPSYVNYVRKARRAEAVEFVSRIQQAQERYRVNNAQYAGAGGSVTIASALSSLGIESIYSSSNTNRYEVTTLTGNATSYTITVTGRGSQASDTGCTTMTAQISAGQLQFLDANGTSSNCWAR